MILSHDIVLNDNAFNEASQGMATLKSDAEALKAKLAQMYQDLTTALDTPAGKELELTAKDVLVKPIEDMILVIDHISATLTEIIGAGYYKDVFTRFEELNQSIK